MMKQELLKLLKPHGQEHLLAFWDELAESEQRALAEQVRGVDFGLIQALCASEETGDDWAALARRAKPPTAFRLNDRGRDFSADDARTRGGQAIADGKVAVVLVAGGQGSRLGFDHPKGMFPIGPVSGASLFQILFEQVAAIGRRYDARIPLCVMTSPATHDETVEFLARNEHFGLAADDVTIFCQATMPAVDAATGKLLLAEKGKLFLSPDGHGGMPSALAESGTLDKLRSHGTEQLYYLQVDNPLAGLCDPVFLGNHLLSESEMSTQVIAKQDPTERVGIVVRVDGRLRIIEYSDLPDDIARLRAADGSLLHWAGSIAIHVFDLDFLKRTCVGRQQLPYHLARKAVGYIDESGRMVLPKKPNAIKFERFIFDLLPEAAHGIVVEVDPARSFAPLKNAPGDDHDSPESVRAQMSALHTQWLKEAGATVANGVAIEISPLFALDAAQCMERIEPNLHVTEPKYFRCSTP